MFEELKQLIAAGQTKIDKLNILCNSAVVGELLELVRLHKLEITEIQLSFLGSNVADRSRIILEFMEIFQHISGVQKLVLDDTVQNYVLADLLSNQSILQLKYLEFKYGPDHGVLFDALLPKYLEQNNALGTLKVQTNHNGFYITTQSHPKLKAAMIAHPRLTNFSQGFSSILDPNRLEKDKDLVAAFTQKIQEDPVLRKQMLDRAYDTELNYLIYFMERTTKPDFPNNEFQTENAWKSVNDRLGISFANLRSISEGFTTLYSNSTPEVKEEINKKKNAIVCSLGIMALLGVTAQLKEIDTRTPGRLNYEQLMQLNRFWDIDRPKILAEVVPVLQSGNTALILPQIMKAGKELSRILDEANPVIFPSSYTAITVNEDDPLLKAKLLLEDYTKHNSAVSRFFHGHWNRHHVREVNSIVLRINSQEADAINDVDSLISELRKIQLVNENGSLARRIQFIDKHCNVSNEQLEIPDGDMQTQLSV